MIDSDKVKTAIDILGERVRQNVPLGALTTYRVGGKAALFMQVTNQDDLLLASKAVSSTGIRVLTVGNGSNLLVSDAGFDGLVIAMTGEGEFNSMEFHDCSVKAGAAVSLPVLARRAVAQGLTGFEWAVGVPGSVGGAVRMNAGGHGSEMSERVTTATIIDLRTGETTELNPVQLEFGYRSSSIREHQVVTFAELALQLGDKTESEARLSEIVKWRRSNQPGGQNAGSVFVNPKDLSAGQLVEQAGLKGFEYGSAQVSDKHANFVQAKDGGSANDVWSLIQLVRQTVADHTGIWLETEVRTVGFDRLDDQQESS